MPQRKVELPPTSLQMTKYCRDFSTVTYHIGHAMCFGIDEYKFMNITTEIVHPMHMHRLFRISVSFMSQVLWSFLFQGPLQRALSPQLQEGCCLSLLELQVLECLHVSNTSSCFSLVLSQFLAQSRAQSLDIQNRVSKTPRICASYCVSTPIVEYQFQESPCKITVAPGGHRYCHKPVLYEGEQEEN